MRLISHLELLPFLAAAPTDTAGVTAMLSVRSPRSCDHELQLVRILGMISLNTMHVEAQHELCQDWLTCTLVR